MARVYFYAGLVTIIYAFQITSALPTVLATENSTELTQDEQNEGFDSFVSKISTVVSYLGLDTFPLADISFALLTTSGGILEDLSSWNRVDDANMSTLSDGNTNIAGYMNITTMELNFDDFILLPKLFAIGGGSTQFNCSENEFYVNITYGVGTNKKCHVQINNFTLTNLSACTVQFEESSSLNWAAETVGSFVMNFLASKFVSHVSYEVNSLAKLTVGHLNLCA